MADKPVDGSALTRAATAGLSLRLWYMAGLLCATNAVAFVDRSSLPLLINQIERDLQISDTQMSYLVGFAFIVAYSTISIFAGMLVDRVPRRGIIALGIALWSSATALCGFAHSYGTMFFGRFAMGAGESVVGPASMSIIRDAFPANKRGRAVGIWAMGANIGGAAALLGGGAILRFINDSALVMVPLLGTIRSWQLVLIICALAPLPLIVLLFTVAEPTRTGAPQSRGQGLGDALRYMGQRWKIFVPLFVVNGITITMLIGYSTWVPAMYGRVWHLSRPEIGLTLGVLTLVLATSSQFAAGTIMDRLQEAGVKHPIPVLGIIITILALGPGIAMPLAPGATIAWILLGCYMLISTSLFTIGTNFVTGLAPPELAGKITSIHFFWVGICGTALGPTVFAMVSDRFFQGPAAIAYALSVVVGALGVIAMLLYATLLFVSRSEASSSTKKDTVGFP